MSSGWTVLLFWFGYALMGVGTARWAYAVQTRKHPRREETHPDLVLPALFGGFGWPLGLVWLMAGHVIGPPFKRWFMAPARKVRAETSR